MRKILRLGGASCTGKTTIVGLLNEGLGYLFRGTALEPFSRESIGISVPASLIEARGAAIKESDWANGLMDMWDKTALAIEEPYAGSDFSASFSGMEVTNVQLVMPYYMWSARREFGFDKGRKVTAAWVQEGTEKQYEEYAHRIVNDCPRDTHFVCVSDYPVQEIERRDVVDVMMGGGDGFDYHPDDNPSRSAPRNYHRAIFTSGEWIGDKGFAAQMEERINKTLPARMDGMSVIDIGAAEGAFSFAAMERGATFVISCERMPHRVETLKVARSAAKTPITTVNMTLGEERLPNFVRRDGRYDMALMLNVLRHLRDPEARLHEALALSNTLICETVVEEGDGATLGNPPRQSFSLHWMEQVADDCGFLVEQKEAAIESADSRAMFVFERII